MDRGRQVGQGVPLLERRGSLIGQPERGFQFRLNNGNRNPKGVVTDGTYLWVINDSTTDKVFKYTLAGSLLGSWTISTAGASAPTGITLDPASPAHLWVVDNATDRVYQYSNAAGLVSGSKAADAFFALAAGNTNPQGIADPPVPSGQASPLLSNPVSAAVDLVIEKNWSNPSHSPALPSRPSSLDQTRRNGIS